MNIRTALITSTLAAAGLVSGPAHAALQGRDLDGNAATFEAYYDTVLDITWLADANYAKASVYDADGLMNWTAANTWAASLSIVDAVNNITYNNWRLPSVKPINGLSFNYGYSLNGSTDNGFNITSPQSELAYMFYVNLGNSGFYTPAGAPSGCFVSYPSNTCLDNTGPFVNLHPNGFWSGTEWVPDTTKAWHFGTDAGRQSEAGKSINFAAWAVYDGDVAAVPEASTWTMVLAGLGLVGYAARRRRG